VERVNQYMDIQSEAEEIIEENRPPPDWPHVGRVELKALKVINDNYLCQFLFMDKLFMIYNNSL
jgi:hypothetical protein